MIPDSTTIRMVIVVLAITALVCVAIAGVLAIDEKAIPDVFIAIPSGAIGSISSLLVVGGAAARTQNVRVVDQPVEVDDVGAVETAVCIALCVVCFIVGWLAHGAGLFT